MSDCEQCGELQVILRHTADRAGKAMEERDRLKRERDLLLHGVYQWLKTEVGSDVAERFDAEFGGENDH